MPAKTCSICSAPGDAAETVNAMLQKRIPLKQIALETGFSKSAVHRHSQKCFVRHKATALKEKRFDAERNRVLTALPDGRYFVQGDPLNPALNRATITESELRADDWIVRVTYAPETAPRELAKAEPEEPDAALAEAGPDADEINIAADENETVESTPEPTPCEHDWKSPAHGVERCTKCGTQKPVVQVFDVSRVENEKRSNKNHFSRTLGRFG